ncbi:MAG: hypothetical protein LBH92_05835 [Bacteroidales bacterium]|jgi:hypothetical protein|nr:hypothetical protein [Bacteroidales bacterium]
MNKELFQELIDKSEMEAEILKHTKDAFSTLKTVLSETEDAYKSFNKKKPSATTLEYNDLKGNELELTFGGDVLRFAMHSNVFLIPRYDPINNTPYLREDSERGYCGVINIYNFLSDSFKYKRYDDIGYLIGRILINKENRYFIQGKRELSRYLNNFSENPLSKKSLEEMVHSAMSYTINFDLLVPPYDQVKEVSVLYFQTTMENSKLLPTGKRLGFRFAADIDNPPENV